jgi:hypothetical protein
VCCQASGDPRVNIQHSPAEHPPQTMNVLAEMDAKGVVTHEELTAVKAQAPSG